VWFTRFFSHMLADFLRVNTPSEETAKSDQDIRDQWKLFNPYFYINSIVWIQIVSDMNSICQTRRMERCYS